MSEREFEQFFRENEALLFRLVRGYVHSRDKAQDIVLEAMTIVYRNWERVRNFENRTGYLVRIGINMAKKSLLFQKKEKVIYLEDQDSMDYLFRPSASPENIAIWGEEDLFLKKCLSSLREEERNVIMLRDLERKRFEDIAGILGIKLPTVKSHYRRGKINLAGKMEAYYEK